MSDPTTQDDCGDPTQRSGNERTQQAPITPQSPSFFDNADTEFGFEFEKKIAVYQSDQLPVEFGNYVLLERVGEGGAGIVFRARQANAVAVESESGTNIAIKLIRPEIMSSQKAVMRFQKEARIQSGVVSPYVTRHLDFGVQNGLYFIASEFVSGVPLNEMIDVLKERPEKESLRIIEDVLRALKAMGDKGVIHRDIKPANVIVDIDSAPHKFSLEAFSIAKLTDFGLARHIEQSESMAMTRQQAILGTPLYMAPEQNLESNAVDARADIYATGATLYHLLTGEAPFNADTAFELAELHRNERAKSPCRIRKEISEAVGSIVLKALEKDPNLRYQTAGEMLSDVENAIHNQPISIRLYPETPNSENRKSRQFRFEWTIDSTPAKLWPLIADTDRFNRAIGLPAPEFSYKHEQGDRQIFADANFNGMKVRWLEHPFQWVYKREMSILREFESGPFQWVTSTVELHPLNGNQTRLVHRFQAMPRGLLGKLLTPIQFGWLTKRSLDRVYSRIEQIANDTNCGYACDLPFHQTKSRNIRTECLDTRIQSLATAFKNRNLLDQFSQYLREAADPFVARIRPIPLSERLDCTKNEAIELCMRSVAHRILDLSWDVICPTCRVASESISTLENLKSHAHCKACDSDFETDFRDSVEIIFSVHADIRDISRKNWCIGGPFHAPHVLAQNRLQPSQQIDVGLQLVPGNYEICSPQTSEASRFDANEKSIVSRMELQFGKGVAATSSEINAGQASFRLKNGSNKELMLRLENRSDSLSAISALKATQNPLFQELFPRQAQSLQLVEVSNLYLVAIRATSIEKLIERLGELDFQDQWNSLQQSILGLSTTIRLVNSNADSFVVAVPSVAQLQESLELLFRLAIEETSDFDSETFGVLVASGEVKVRESSSGIDFVGKVVRQCQQKLALLTAGEIRIDQSVENFPSEIFDFAKAAGFNTTSL